MPDMRLLPLREKEKNLAKKEWLRYTGCENGLGERKKGAGIWR